MKYYGKEKCRILKEIRAEIARQNGIAWTVESCAHKGNCRGTCPKCEAEVVALALEKLGVQDRRELRQLIGKNLFRTVDLAALPLCHFVDLFERQGMMEEPASAAQSGIGSAPTGKVVGEDIMGGMPLPESESETEEATVGGVYTDETTELLIVAPLPGEPDEEFPVGKDGR